MLTLTPEQRKTIPEQDLKLYDDLIKVGTLESKQWVISILNLHGIIETKDLKTTLQTVREEFKQSISDNL